MMTAVLRAAGRCRRDTWHMITLIENHLQEIVAICSRHSVTSLALVGSASRGDFDIERSDIDVLVDFLDGDINHFRAFMGLRKDFTELLGRPVDVITLRGIQNPLLLQSLKQDAVTLYAA